MQRMGERRSFGNSDPIFAPKATIHSWNRPPNGKSGSIHESNGGDSRMATPGELTFPDLHRWKRALAICRQLRTIIRGVC
jgi:hypothetical protein